MNRITGHAHQTAIVATANAPPASSDFAETTSALTLPHADAFACPRGQHFDNATCQCVCDDASLIACGPVCCVNGWPGQCCVDKCCANQCCPDGSCSDEFGRCWSSVCAFDEICCRDNFGGCCKRNERCEPDGSCYFNPFEPPGAPSSNSAQNNASRSRPRSFHGR